MARLSAEAIGLSYRQQGRELPVLDGLDITIDSGDAVVVLGPSGCGKSSLLHVLAGFLAPSTGRIRLDGRDAGPPGGDRGVVFQEHALLPWRNVLHNVTLALGPQLRGVGAVERETLARRMLKQVGLAAYAKQRIGELSGGQRQRLGLARALAVNPAFLLLDEPFGALDALTRERMQSLLLKIWKETGKGLFLITHSVEEALLLATDLLVMDGPPARIRRRYAPPFSRRFLAGESLRTLKADPLFERDRRDLLALFMENGDEPL